jgi:glutamine synthetase
MEKNMNNNIKLEYLWLDGYATPNIRSKTKYTHIESDPNKESITIDEIPEWGFDGSSTGQAVGEDSDCILKPVAIFNNTTDTLTSTNSYLVLCEVMNSDGTPHESNTRVKVREMDFKFGHQDFWFGIEQEYTIMDSSNGRPLGWPESRNEYPSPQGRYYCGVGGDVVKMRQLVHEHAMVCNMAGVPLGGTNSEVMLAQWEYQIGTAGILEICDYLWVSRYMLEICAENHDVSISLDPKLVQGDWNGSGAHINFSTKFMREDNNKDYVKSVLKSLEESHDEHIKNYGIGNENRLTGDHETQHISKFSYGKSDRGASIRIPVKDGYLEDRRPASNVDPYRAVAKLVETVGKCEPVAVTA